MSLDIGTLAGYLDLDTSAFDRKLDRTDETAKRSGRKSGKGFGDEFGKESNAKVTGAARRIMKGFGDILGVTAKPTAITVATAFSAQFLASIGAALASGAVKLAHGFAAGLALLPSVALAGGLAIGTLKVALSGMADVLKAGLTGDTEAFEEGLEGLSPSARAVAREIVGVKGSLDGLKATVQENFFGQFAGQIRPLADALLPSVERTMGGVARSFGIVASESLGFLSTPAVAKSLDGALANVQATLVNVAGGAGNLVQALLPLVTVGSTFLPQLTDGFGSLSSRFAEFMVEAERTGQLRDFIQGGIDSIRSLIDTGQQVARIFGNIGTVISTAFSSGGGLLSGLGLQTGGILDTFERLTEQAAEFVQTARGSTVVGQVFTVIRNLLNTLFGTFQRLAPVVGRVFGPILPQIAEFTSAVVELAGSIVEALEPALGVISDVIGAILPPITELFDFLARNQPVIQGIAIGIAAALVPAFVTWAVSAGAAAVATLLALAPLILIGVAVAALATLVIIHFDTIKNAIMTAFNWVRDNWPLLLAILTGPIGIAVLLITTHWDTIKAGFTAVKDWISARIEDIVGFFTGLPGRLADAGSGLFNWITSGISSAVDWVRNRINDMISAFNALPFVGNIDRIGGATKTFGGSRGSGGRRLHTGRIGGDEMVAILQQGESVLAKNDPLNKALQAGGRSGAAGAGLAGRIVLDVTGTDAEMVEMVRKRVRVDYGGDVQIALGQG